MQGHGLGLEALEEICLTLLGQLHPELRQLVTNRGQAALLAEEDVPSLANDFGAIGFCGKWLLEDARDDHPRLVPKRVVANHGLADVHEHAAQLGNALG